MDGWNRKPDGWNVFDYEEWDDDIIDVDLAEYPHQYIFVLAGGLDHLGRNHPWVKDRLDVAFRLYQQKRRTIVILGGGTYHKPPHINREKFVIHESTMGAKYLIDLGVKQDDIVREWGSYDTIANGYFSLMNFTIPFQLGSDDQILVITSDFHMTRSKLIFGWIYGLWDKTSGKGSKNNSTMPIFDYLEVSTKYLDEDIIDARSIKEAKSIESLKKTINQVDDWKKLIRWFYRDHKAYNCQFTDKKEEIDERTRRSY